MDSQSQTEHSYDFPDQRTSSSGGGELKGSSAPGVQSLSLPAAPPELPDCRPSFGGSPELPDCRRATPAGLFSSQRTPAGAAGMLRRQFSSQSTLPDLTDWRPDSFDGGQTAAEASAAVRQLRWCCRSFAGSPAAPARGARRQFGI
ncbi:unnamed protein product [Boreogadus saida]